MKKFIKNILSFKNSGIYEKEECLFVNEHFVLVKDKKMIHNDVSNLHLTAWCKNLNIQSLKNLHVDYLIHLKEIESKTLDIIKKNYNGFDNVDVFIHYPPQFWQLHIHFRNKILPKNSPDNEKFYLKDVLNELQNNNIRGSL